MSLTLSALVHAAAAEVLLLVVGKPLLEVYEVVPRYKIGPACRKVPPDLGSKYQKADSELGGCQLELDTLSNHYFCHGEN